MREPLGAQRAETPRQSGRQGKGSAPSLAGLIGCDPRLGDRGNASPAPPRSRERRPRGAREPGVGLPRLVRRRVRRSRGSAGRRHAPLGCVESVGDDRGGCPRRGARRRECGRCAAPGHRGFATARCSHWMRRRSQSTQCAGKSATPARAARLLAGAVSGVEAGALAARLADEEAQLRVGRAACLAPARARPLLSLACPAWSSPPIGSGSIPKGARRPMWSASPMWTASALQAWSVV